MTIEQHESMQWHPSGARRVAIIRQDDGVGADRIVEWVNANGGEAVYQPAINGILVRQRFNMAGVCSPGQRVVMGGEYSYVVLADGGREYTRTRREFTVEDA